MILHTNRLTLRPFRTSDSESFFQMFADPETMRYMHVRPHRTAEQTAAYFEHDIRYGAAYWSICLKGTDAPIGSLVIMANTQVPGMGYMLRREHWGQGYMTEALGALLDVAFNERRFDRVELWINEGNRASQRVAEKLGFRVKGRIHQRYDWEDNHHIMLCYGLWAEEWAGAVDPQPRPRPAVYALQPVLPVRSVPETIAFYREKLGFDLSFTAGNPPNHAGLALGRWSGESAMLQVTQAAPEEEFQPQGWLYFMVEAQIDALYERFLANGVEILRPPQTYPWWMREFSVRDLNGYELRFGTQHVED